MSGNAQSGAELELVDDVADAWEEVTGTRPDLRLDANLQEDLGLESLQRFELLIALEERWDIELADDPDVTHAPTVRELLLVVRGLLAGGD